jgi:hypothetical protein
MRTPKRPFGDALDKLERTAAMSKPTSAPLPDTMYPADIKLVPEVFQPRTIEGAMGADADHVRELERGLRAQGKAGFLDPILVIRVGKRTLCVDGHHRLVAYRNQKTERPVPVEWFAGSIREAVVETAKRNARDRLPMRRREKLEAAWRMTILDAGHSKAEIAEATTVAVATIATMRKTLKLILADQAKHTDKWDRTTLGPEPRNMTWEEAKSYGKDAPNRDEDWEDKLALKWSKQLASAFGGKWGLMPKVAAKAIDLYSERLSEGLINYWLEEAREIVAAAEGD